MLVRRIRWAMALGIIVLVVAAGAPATAASPASVAAGQDNIIGRVAWEMGGDLYLTTIFPDRLTRQRLTTGMRAANPVFSPGGTAIAFDSDRNGNREIFFYRLDLRRVFRVTRTPERESYPTWAPPGAGLVFQRQSGQDFALYFAQTDGSGYERWSEANQHADFWPGWYPGTKIAFTRGRQIWTLDLNGDRLRRITTNTTGSDDQSAWNFAGTRIAFKRYGTNGQYQLYSVAGTGGPVTKISRGQNLELFPAYSPDDSMLAFVRAVPGGDCWISSVTGANARKITSGGECNRPTWDPSVK